MEKAIEHSSSLAPGAKASALKHYLEAADGVSNSEARDIAADVLGERIRWDWDSEYPSRQLHQHSYSSSDSQLPRLARVTTITPEVSALPSSDPWLLPLTPT